MASSKASHKLVCKKSLIVVNLRIVLDIGPGNCLGVIAAKSGPTAVRGQYYGLTAATGKVGAFVGTWGESFLLASSLQ